ncbi:unnamed protein product [Orchesella dallaii]|uniref:Long-chain-fatty-acid--CoA ligase n=1 Tax=Orchesella dallaii TaxID=48710 RepID=A0ABP1R1Q0_9HEXA
MDVSIAPILDFIKHCLIFVTLVHLWKWKKFILIILTTIRRDISLLYALYVTILLSWIGRRRRNETFCKSIDKIVKEGGADRICFYFGDEKWTYKQVQGMSLRVANYFQGIGLQKGDAVGIAMTNRPEYAVLWLGLGRIGVVSVLINNNLRGDSLENCVSVVKCKALIIGTELKEVFEEIWNGKGRNLLPQKIYELDRFLEEPGWSPGNTAIPNEQVSMPTSDLANCLWKTGKGSPILPKGQEPGFLDPLMYMFTSGTTGVPKAVRCSHGRMFFMASTALVLNFSSEDVSISAAPMYHIAGLFGTVWAFCFGAPAVIVVKFSASQFWKDVHRYKATVCMYVGEFCRFLVNQPVQPELEKGHTLRAMFGGGGLRPEVWEAFQKRFKVKQFVDIYASTEGNCTMINLEGKIGACGYIPVWFQPIHPIQLVKVDAVTGEICRNEKTGFAIRCEDDEPGELIGKIIDSVPMARFDGYTDRIATEKKIERNVLCQGDKYFRTADIMSRDKFGYYHFEDRLGDIFRWKAENVATTSVEGAISCLTGMRNNVVYGVNVPGTEGSAGMAAILEAYDGEMDIPALAEGMKKSLPKYGIPMFVRVVKNIKGLDMTGTFKFLKSKLKQEGFDVEKTEDTIYIYSTCTESYNKLDLDTFKEVMKGNYRF